MFSQMNQSHGPFDAPQISSRPALVKWRLKGNLDGPIYEGSQIIKPCAGCGQPRDMKATQRNHPNLVRPSAFPTASQRRQSPKPYVSQKPKPFTVYEPRHERAIVCPWLSVNEAWDELKHSLRSIHRFFKDKECPIYVIGNKAPTWLKPGERVQFILIPEYQHSRAAGLWAANQIGLQIADEVCWTNDDIYFLRPTGWDDLRIALTEGTLDDQEDALRSSQNGWRQAMGDACAELKKRGHSPIWRFATHTPYLFEREKSIEVMREFYLAFKGSWVNIYHNHHRTPHEPCAPHKTNRLPVPGNHRYLNHKSGGPDPRTQDELRRLLSTKAPWER